MAPGEPTNRPGAGPPPHRRSFLWRVGVLEFSLPTVLLVWVAVTVDQAGWEALVSVRGLLSLVVGLLLSIPLGWLTGALFYWWFFSRKAGS